MCDIGQIQQLIHQFQQHPMAWTRVDTIMEKSQSQETKFIALNILLQCIKYRWNILPPPQREGIRSFLVNLIIRVSKDPQQAASQANMLSKLNLTLIEVS